MAYWIIVVDDDTANLQVAGLILSRNDMRVTALRSGKALLDYVAAKGQPDLFLLDINMPEMDGFETLRRLREWEHQTGKDETPVIFLTADEEAQTERQGFEAGVSDYIRKPFDTDILLRRIKNILSKQERINSLRAEASTDRLTGLLNKAGASAAFAQACAARTGCLMMIDLDSFKLVNDLYGHEMGDRVLVRFAELLSEHTPADSQCARLGGDEFAAFCQAMTAEQAVKDLTETLNRCILADAKSMMGEDMAIPLGVSVGAVFAPAQGQVYENLLRFADKALYAVKQNGKHGCMVYSPDTLAEDSSSIDSVESDLLAISAILGERNIPNSAQRLDKEIFSGVYQYIMRYIIRNQRNACKVLFTVSSEAADTETFEEYCTAFGEHIKNCLRKSDILMRSHSNQYFVLLADVHEASVKTVVGNIVRSWNREHGNVLSIRYVTEFVGGAQNGKEPARVSRILVADSDMESVRAAGQILSSGGYYVTALRSGQALLDYVRDYTPDLILLAVSSPGINGFELMKQLGTAGSAAADIPVLLISGDEDAAARSRGLALGAMDYVSKPFEADVLLNRVRHAVELVLLRRSMSLEVDKKIRENKDSLLQMLRVFAEMIDTKDCSTAGQSLRVAEYAVEIAKRAGFSVKQQTDIYMAALLHDVGKLCVPDAIITKPAALTEEEMDTVRMHAAAGAAALEQIRDLPGLAAGARWHHERYEGGGYPDGLTGENIPDEARIIAVADAYAAMTSRRSYRDRLPQEMVLAELERGKGTQFDPQYADIMIALVKESADGGIYEE